MTESKDFFSESVDLAIREQVASVIKTRRGFA
jgi:hypothetical protein